jgi:hypothetical protein
MTIEDAIQRAHALVKKTRKSHTVYQRGDNVAVVPLKTYITANLDSKGARRIVTVSVTEKVKLF